MPVFVVVFIAMRYIVMSYCKPVDNKHHFSHRGRTKRFVLLPLKAVERNFVDTTGFLRIIVVLIRLFIFDDFLESFLLKKEEPHCC